MGITVTYGYDGWGNLVRETLQDGTISRRWGASCNGTSSLAFRPGHNRCTSISMSKTARLTGPTPAARLRSSRCCWRCGRLPRSPCRSMTPMRPRRPCWTPVPRCPRKARSSGCMSLGWLYRGAAMVPPERRVSARSNVSTRPTTFARPSNWSTGLMTPVRPRVWATTWMRSTRSKWSITCASTAFAPRRWSAPKTACVRSVEIVIGECVWADHEGTGAYGLFPSPMSSSTPTPRRRICCSTANCSRPHPSTHFTHLIKHPLSSLPHVRCPDRAYGRASVHHQLGSD
ncbi:MAG: hypothetical protein GFH23_1086718n58 [Chloroflexi bacterium AL-N1]|nr:hypothetical protein [Chloroflexi bacterium AL-N1]NOK77287.1 hypothetical protein [Chloroflexi bacterium AL-N5]